MFGLGGSRIVIRTPRGPRGADRTGGRRIVVKGPPNPLAARVAAFVADLPIERGTIRIGRTRTGPPRLTFSRGIDERLVQRVRNYALSLSSR